MAHALKLAFNGDPNIGMYGVATDKFVLLGKSVPQKYVKEIEEALEVPVIQINVYGTSLVGIFIVATSRTVLVPDLIFEAELKEIVHKLKPLGVEVKTIKTQHTALCNNILVNDKVGIISTEYDKTTTKKISEALGIKAIQLDLMGSNVPGSIGVLTNKGAIFGSNLSDDEIKKIEKLTGFEIGLGSINMGSPLMHSGVMANSNGFLIGSLSSGYEISRVDESLRLI